MDDWAAYARAALSREPTALVTVLATEGSAPRGPGARMVVTRGGMAGTIGGGALEYRSIGQARTLLDQPKGMWRIQDYPLGPLLGQCCGGRVRLLIEHLDADRSDWLAAPRTFVAHLGEDRIERISVTETADLPQPSARGERPASGAAFREPDDTHRLPLLLFGAGHVGRAIARIADRLPIHLAWFDVRPECHDIAGVATATEDELAACAAGAADDAAIVIVTHDHALDYRLTAAALGGGARFVGLIGSATKRARFASRLAAGDLDRAAQARLTCPIGLPGIVGKEPAVIAVAVIAQLLSLRER